MQPDLMEYGVAIVVVVVALEKAFACARWVVNRANGTSNNPGSSAVLQAVRDLHSSVRGQNHTLTEIRDAAKSAQSRSGRILGKLNRLLGIQEEEGL